MRRSQRRRARPRRALLAFAIAVLAAGAGGCAETAPDEAGTPGEAAAPATFVAVDIDYEDAPDTLPPGAHTFELVNDGSLPHTVTIEELDDRVVVETQGGETATGEVELEAGTYTYYCSIAGHRDAGMEGTIEVTGDAG